MSQIVHTLNPGESVIIPKNATITSIVTSGSINVTSSCTGILPIPTAYKCGSFYVIVDSDDNPGHSMDEQDTFYTSLKIGTTIWL